MIYVTSDQHFYHKAVIGYCNRPFADLEEMHNELIRRWNKTIGDDDEVFVIGDFSFKQPGYILEKLNGKLHLIYGNHDGKQVRKHPRWQSVNLALEFKLNHQLYVMCHYPFESWKRSRYGTVHLHGHCHGHGRPVRGRLDVGVDCHDYYPVDLFKAEEMALAVQGPEADQHRTPGKE